MPLASLFSLLAGVLFASKPLLKKKILFLPMKWALFKYKTCLFRHQNSIFLNQKSPRKHISEGNDLSSAYCKDNKFFPEMQIAINILKHLQFPISPSSGIATTGRYALQFDIVINRFLKNMYKICSFNKKMLPLQSHIPFIIIRKTNINQKNTSNEQHCYR